MGQLKNYAIDRCAEYRDALTIKGRARSLIGTAHATSMVVNAAANLELLTGGVDPVQSQIKAFSAQRNKENVKRFSNDMPSMAVPSTIKGISSVQNLQTVSAIDITLQVLIFSFLPWIAIERPMTDSTQTISWREVVALNDAGGVSKGDTLIGNFTPENPALDLKSPLKTLTANSADAVVILNYNAQLFEGTVMLTMVRGGVSYVGKDIAGVVVFPGITDSFTVDYETGILTSKASMATGTAITAVAMIDVMASGTGSNIVRTTTKMRSVQMVSVESSIIIEDSVDRMMFILKTIDQSAGALNIEQYMQQMLFDLYLAYINNSLMVLIHQRSAQLEGTQALDDLTLDLSSYGGQIIAEPNRKYDELATLTESADNKMLSTVNKGVTAWIVGSRICNIMAADAFRFKKSDTFNKQMNTLAGVYNGKPVLRHQYIDRFIDGVDAEGFGNAFGIHRDPDGEVGFAAYGEFLPIHTTDNVYNFNNPVQFARALVSQIGMRIIEPGLCVRIKFRVTAPSV